MPPKVVVVRPDITEEEREERIKQLESTLSRLLKCKVTIKKKDENK